MCIKNLPQWQACLDDFLSRVVGHKAQVDLDGAVLDRPLCLVQLQQNFAKIEVVSLIGMQRVHMNAVAVKILQRRRHVVLVHEQALIRLGHRRTVNGLNGRQHAVHARVEIVERIKHRRDGRRLRGGVVVHFNQA